MHPPLSTDWASPLHSNRVLSSYIFFSKMDGPPAGDSNPSRPSRSDRGARDGFCRSGRHTRPQESTSPRRKRAVFLWNVLLRLVRNGRWGQEPGPPQEFADRFTGLRAHREPILNPVHLQSDFFVSILVVRNRIVRPNLHKPSPNQTNRACDEGDFSSKGHESHSVTLSLTSSIFGPSIHGLVRSDGLTGVELTAGESNAHTQSARLALPDENQWPQCDRTGDFCTRIAPVASG